MNMNPSPKSEFLKNIDLVRYHHSVMENQMFRTSVATALAEMSRQICSNAPADNMGACASGHLRMLGAQDFVHILLNMAEVPETHAKADTTNLPSNVSRIPGKN